MKKLMNIVEFAGKYLRYLVECYFDEIIKILLKNMKVRIWSSGVRS